MPDYYAAGARVSLQRISLTNFTSKAYTVSKISRSTGELERLEAEIATARLLPERTIAGGDGFGLRFLGDLSDMPFYIAEAGLEFTKIERGDGTLTGSSQQPHGIDSPELTSLSDSSATNFHAIPHPSMEHMVSEEETARIDHSAGNGVNAESTPHALLLTVELSPISHMPKTLHGKDHMDIKIEVFFNGDFASCSLIPGRDRTLVFKNHAIIRQFCGRRIDKQVERPWILQSANKGLLTDDVSSAAVNPEVRWGHIGEALAREARTRGTSKRGRVSPVSEYLQCLARYPMPTSVASTTSGLQMGIVDVVISLGFGKKFKTTAGYNSEPTRMIDSKFMKRDLRAKDAISTENSNTAPKTMEQRDMAGITLATSQTQQAIAAGSHATCPQPPPTITVTSDGVSQGDLHCPSQVPHSIEPNAPAETSGRHLAVPRDRRNRRISWSGSAVTSGVASPGTIPAPHAVSRPRLALNELTTTDGSPRSKRQKLHPSDSGTEPASGHESDTERGMAEFISELRLHAVKPPSLPRVEGKTPNSDAIALVRSAGALDNGYLLQRLGIPRVQHLPLAAPSSEPSHHMETVMSHGKNSDPAYKFWTPATALSGFGVKVRTKPQNRSSFDANKFIMPAELLPTRAVPRRTAAPAPKRHRSEPPDELAPSPIIQPLLTIPQPECKAGNLVSTRSLPQESSNRPEMKKPSPFKINFTSPPKPNFIGQLNNQEYRNAGVNPSVFAKPQARPNGEKRLQLQGPPVALSLDVNAWPTPELSKNSAITYADQEFCQKNASALVGEEGGEVMGMYRQVKKERAGEFSEESILCGFRFIVR